MYHTPKNGFIALTSALILSIVLALAVTGAAAAAQLARGDLHAYEQHLQARAQAISCLYALAYALGIDRTYRVASTGMNVFIGTPTATCRVESLGVTGVINGTATTSASVGTANARIQGQITIPIAPAFPAILSWKEL